MNLQKRFFFLRIFLYPFFITILLLQTFFLQYPPIPLRQSLFTKLLLFLLLVTIFESFRFVMLTDQKPMEFLPSAKKTLQKFWFILLALFVAVVIIGSLMVQDTLLLGLLFGAIMGFAILVPCTIGLIFFSFIIPYLKPILLKKNQ